MSDHSKKLKSLKKKEAIRDVQIIGNGTAFIDIIEATVNEFRDALELGVDINDLDQFVEQLGELKDIAPVIKNLQATIESIELPTEVSIKGLDTLIQATKILSTKKDIQIEQVDTKPLLALAKQMDVVVKKVADIQAPKQGQNPGDYVPMRRVILVGNRLMYDDARWTGGGGGGSNIPTVNNGAAVPVVNPDGSNISGGGGGGGGAVTVADGADVTLGAKADAKSTATDTTPITAMSVLKQISASVQAPPSQAVTNAGTFAVQATGTVTANQGTAGSAEWFMGGGVASGAADSGNPVKVGGRNNTTLPTLTDGQRGDFQLEPRGGLYVTLKGNNSTSVIESIVDNADGRTVSATANKISVINKPFIFNGTSWDRVYSVANATNSTGTGIAASGMLAQFDDTSPTAVTENSFGNLRMSTNRNLYGTIRDAAGNERGVNVTAGNALVIDGSASTQPVSIAGTVVVDDLAAAATGSAVPANAQYQGGVAQTSLPSAATAGNLTGAMLDKFGRQVVVTDAIRDIVGSQTTTITSSTSETTVATAVASTFLDLTSILISNTSATAARIDFRDTTAGTVLFSIYVPAGDTRGIVFHTPQPQTSVNTNWTAQSSASVADLRIFMKFIKNK